jgi:uncharacterized protein
MCYPQSLMSNAVRVAEIIRSDPIRWHLLNVVADLGLPDCWIAAGFVRNAVWDMLHGQPVKPPQGDVDVIWFDPTRADPAIDRDLEESLHAVEPSIDWSVKNQARMHMRNGDAPYRSAIDAMRYWPETATAVAARRNDTDICEVASPLGLDDLLNLVLRPTTRFAAEKRQVFEERRYSKAWMVSWPLLALAEP